MELKMKKALIVVTNHSYFNDADTEPTGLWLSELTHFYDQFEQAGIAMDIVSPKGGKVPIDSRSLGFFMLDKATKKRYQDANFMALLDNTKPLSEVDHNDYELLYFAGGHGAMWDFVGNELLDTLTREMYETNKIVAAVCHGVAALQNVQLSNGEYLLKGKKGTGFPYFDEAIAGVKKSVPYNLEKNLKNRGMSYSKAFLPLMGHTVVDGLLVTGQNPNSALDTAKAALSLVQHQ